MVTDQINSCRDRSSAVAFRVRTPAGITGAKDDSTELLFSTAFEEIARLTGVLRCQRCAAVLRGVDGTVLPLSPIEYGRGTTDGVVGRDRASRSPDTPSLQAPIHDSRGSLLATLEVIQCEADRSEASEKLVRALLESTARAITERWFRLLHRRRWILAAMPRHCPDGYVLFAVDGDQRVVGADGQGRRMLEKSGRRIDHRPGLSVLFRPNPNGFRWRGCRDISTTLLTSSECIPWIALITPPDIGAADSHHDARTMLHARPRKDSLTHSSALSSEQPRPRGLSAGALRRVEQHIDAHLDSPLDIGELAAVAGMSVSHFTRSFNKAVGLTPHRFVIQYRVMKARELLVSTRLPLTEIALTMGFSDQSHFSRRFQELVGVPPGTFRGHIPVLNRDISLSA